MSNGAFVETEICVLNCLQSQTVSENHIVFQHTTDTTPVVIEDSKTLIQYRRNCCLIGTVLPQTKLLLGIISDSLRGIWFSTGNVSSDISS